MICPKCNKPYLFIDEQQPAIATCIRCFYSESFRQPGYDQYHQKLYLKPYRRDRHSDPQMRKILRFLKVQVKDTVLDLGCGVGDYTHSISEFSENVIGMDLDVSAARHKFPDLDFRNHDLNVRLPFPDASFDFVVSINLIEHLRNEQSFVDECARILKPRGRIALTTANLDFILHKWFYDRTHVHEWSLNQFKKIMGRTFSTIIAEKSSSMFNFYPFNVITTKFLKPDLLYIGTKK
jgi:2-polyprenyl-3-methyl-5-hydroxy-6-metoxy-1,4-benzoquinol methylase